MKPDGEELTHIDENGKAQMVDVGDKGDTNRSATASGRVFMSIGTIEALKKQELQKGDVLGVARVAGIQAAKKTSDLIPLCHPLAINFVSVGSSAQQSLGEDYYAQNYYTIGTYKKLLDEDKFPIFRGIKLNDDDKIRRYTIGLIRTYFSLDFSDVEKKYNIDFDKYFSKELNFLSEYIKDGLVELSKDSIKVTDLGVNFAPQIANVFDKYNPPNHNFESRLDQIKKVAVHPS